MKKKGIIIGAIIAMAIATINGNDVKAAEKITAQELIESNIVTGDDIPEGEELIGGVEEEVRFGGFGNAMLAEVSGVVHITSYATYSKADGMSVYVKLYAPWYTFTNPKFRAMTGVVSGNLGSKKFAKSIVKKANGTSTISQTIDTGLKAKSGTKWKVDVKGGAVGDNVITGAGAFSICYDVEIP